MDTTLRPYLVFGGNGAEAMTFYQSVLGGELEMQPYGEAGQTDDPGQRDRLMHAHLANGTLTLMASDDAPGNRAMAGSNVHLSINGSDEVRLTECFSRLSEGGTVDMPLQKQFWGDTFGMLTDRFGIHWMVNISSPGPER